MNLPHVTRKQFNFEQGILTMWGSSIVWCEQGLTGLLAHDQKSICGSLGSGQSEYGAAEVSCYSCWGIHSKHMTHTLCLIVYSRCIEYDWVIFFAGWKHQLETNHLVVCHGQCLAEALEFGPDCEAVPGDWEGHDLRCEDVKNMAHIGAWDLVI